MKVHLTARDFEAIQSAILELNSFGDFTAFRKALPATMLRLIPADYFVWNELAFIKGLPHAVDFAESKPGVLLPFIKRLYPVFTEHPFNREFLQNPDPSPLLFSDFYTLKKLYATPLYKIAYGPVEGWSRQLSVPIHLHPGLISSLNFCDRRRNFTERDRAVLNTIKPFFKQAYQNTEITSARTTAAGPLLRYQLTTREGEIGLWLSEGKSNPEIASITGISARTVEKHVENILAKLGVENRTSAAVMIASARKQS
jgi:DNA-binding CsgD family transcriptional regulator